MTAPTTHERPGLLVLDSNIRSAATVAPKEDAPSTARGTEGSKEVSGAHKIILSLSAAKAMQSQPDAARWLPNPHSCAGQLLLELIERAASGDDQGITPRDFLGLAWSQRMAVYIHRLRQGGWEIETELREAANRFERVKHAAYFLVLDVDLEQPEFVEWVAMACEVRA
tara:strand:+ start:50954 stop:51460 length:507 start_codon:yes stop_codon:yes gene_type:complete